MQGIEMEVDLKTKKYCIRGMHVVIISVVVAVVGLSVGLGVGLTRPEPCRNNEAEVPTQSNPSASIPTTIQPEQESCPVKDDHSGDWSAFRLPDYINPVHYELEVQPQMEEDTYNGTVTIWLKLTRPETKHLWLHIRQTKIIGEPRLSKGADQQIPLKQCFHYLPHEYVVVESQQVLEPNAGDTNEQDTYRLTLQFAGRLDGSLVGFYRTTYQENGVTKSIAATDHEPTDARKSFPCFDEPNKKATYTISIIHTDTYEALSNMPVQETVSKGNGWKRTLFYKSVPMSTYLVCFAIHQFKYVERTSARGIPLRIYAQPLQLHTAEYAANITKIVFDYFEEYFNMNYSLPKLDKIAIPDFGTGAMENWGLITYRETNLLFDPAESATANKKRVATVIAHELVHQWFGNIVTMNWWDDLWLNEGFASFFEYLGVDIAEPTWNMRDQILNDDVLPVMIDDALQSSHPIVVTVSTPAEITSVFDSISYNKGASILRMLEDWISRSHFQEGCRNYLKKHHFQNAKTDDFWEALAQASGKPVKEVMDTWTRQMSFPVLNVKSNNTVIQKRFLQDPKANILEPPSELNYKWNIPVTYYALSDKQLHTVMYNLSESAGVILSPYDPDKDGFQKINPKHIGFFRVNYENSTWNHLSSLLLTNHENFSETDRGGFIDDAFALASAEQLDYDIALNLTKYLQRERNYIPWQRVSSALSYIINMLEDDNTIYHQFQKYFRRQVKPITDELGWNHIDDDLKKLLRVSVQGLACRMDDPKALSNVSELFAVWLNGTSLPANLRQLVYRYGMKQSGDQKAWDFMFSMYLNTSLAQEKDKLLQGLAAVNSIPLLDRYLKYIYNTSLIRSQDALTILQYISQGSKHGKSMAWDWVRLNWEYLVSRYTITDRNLGRVVLGITRSFNTESRLWQVKVIF
ncbi:hypothetical protein FKM82_001413 [Ascaphus truei]